MTEETPLLKQYRAVKAEHPGAILMFRIGDFFEMFEQDAETAARELELTLTSKAMGKAGRLPLAGVPHHAVDAYVARLVRKGYHVAICDQAEDPKKAKGLVRREVTRIVTPGTWTGGDGRANKFIAALRAGEEGEGRRKPAAYPAAACDLLTGELYVGVLASTTEVEAFLARFRPAEVILSDAAAAPEEELVRAASPEAFVTRLPSWRFGTSFAEDLLRNHFGVSTLAGFGLKEGVLGPPAAVLSYLKETQKSALAHIASIVPLDGDETVRLDASTLLQLEIVDSPSRDTETTLLATLDRAVTAMGSRLIARRLTAPLCDAAAIRERLDAVEAFHSDFLARAEARERMKTVFDLERLAGRLSLGTVSPREVTALASSLEAVPSLAAAARHGALGRIREALDPVVEVTSLVRAKLVETPPLEFGEGPLFREGVEPRLDELRDGSRASRQWIAELQARERERTGIASLKVGFNNVFGYYIEVTRANLEKVPPDYRRKQTTANGERYFTEELKHHEEIVLSAQEKVTELEQELFAALRGEIALHIARIQRTASAVAELDLCAAFAEVAVERRYVRPELIDESRPFLRIEKGRHPVVEALLSGEESFVPNETILDARQRFMVLTGPNMAGKSTYIRQVAVIALMAQVGSFVPADRCVMSPFDGIHARIGASDRLARGLSTFMVEMIEAAMILRNATKRSLVILDEIGRGTSTYDGLSIAWAMVEALSARGCLALFATHYHELTSLADDIDGVHNATVAVKEWGEKIHFLHEIRPGAADRSYGIQVASLAGVPKNVLERAKEILGGLEMGELRQKQEAEAGAAGQISLFSALADVPQPEREIAEELRRIDPDAVAPREALEILARLKAKLS